MPAIAASATAYVATVFAFAFCLGVLRVTVIAPRIGELAAVALEVPLVLAASWRVAARVLRRWPLPRPVQRLAMGAIALALLMGAEATLARLAFGQPVAEWLATMGRPAGLLGLAGQVGFALVPWARLRVQA